MVLTQAGTTFNKLTKWLIGMLQRKECFRRQKHSTLNHVHHINAALTWEPQLPLSKLSNPTIIER